MVGLGRRTIWSQAALGAQWGLTASLSNGWWLWLKGSGSIAQTGRAWEGKSSFNSTLALSQSFCTKDSRWDPNLIQVNDRIWVKVSYNGVWTFFSSPSSWHDIASLIPLPQGRGNTATIWRNRERKADNEMWSGTQGHQVCSSYKIHDGLEISIPDTQDCGFTSCPQFFQEILLALFTQVINPVVTQEQRIPPTVLLLPLPSATLEVSSEIPTKALTKSAQPGISVGSANWSGWYGSQPPSPLCCNFLSP